MTYMCAFFIKLFKKYEIDEKLVFLSCQKKSKVHNEIWNFLNILLYIWHITFNWRK